MTIFYNMFSFGPYLRSTIVLIFIGLVGHLQSQTEIYSETFATAGEGIVGACTGTKITTCASNTPASNGQWTITGNASGLEAGDVFQTAGGSMIIQDADEELCFRSSMIDISTHENIMLMVDLREEGDLEAADFVDVTYIVDGVATLITDFNGQGSAAHTLIGINSRDPIIDDEWQSVSIQENLFDGSMLEVEICFDCNTDTETFFLDQVIVKGNLKDVIDEIPTIGQWSLFITGLLFSSLGLIYLKKSQLA